MIGYMSTFCLSKESHFTTLRAKRAKNVKFSVFCLRTRLRFGQSQLLIRGILAEQKWREISNLPRRLVL